MTALTKSKIVATLGPRSWDADHLAALRREGVDMFRLNFSHAGPDASNMITAFHRIREHAPALAVLCDIQGPKLRLGEVEGKVTLQEEHEFVLHGAPVVGNEDGASLDAPGVVDHLEPGDAVYINDGIIQLEVAARVNDGQDVRTRVVRGGTISSKKGVNIPSYKLTTNYPTAKDRRDLETICELAPEYVGASFIENGRQIESIRAILAEGGVPGTRVIAKIERPLALENLDEILARADGVMVARGDLGIEIPAEEVPIRQKHIIRECNKLNKPVIVATQMLESMINHPVPTRAEVNDVFNAIYDRADAVMLSGETATGTYPLESVRYMDRIIRKAEVNIPPVDPATLERNEPNIYEALSHTVNALASFMARLQMSAKILIFTRGGNSPRSVAKYRPAFPILALTGNRLTARQLQLVWGVHPYYLPTLKIEDWEAEEIIRHGIKHLLQFGVLDYEEYAICTVPSRITEEEASVVGIYECKTIVSEDVVNTRTYAPDWTRSGAG